MFAISHVAILIATPRGFPIVMDPNRKPPLLWKLAGGHYERYDRHSLEKTAVREAWEETGARLTGRPTHVLTALLETGKKIPLCFHLCFGRWDNLSTLRERGIDGEYIDFIPEDQLCKFEDPDFFLPQHAIVLQQAINNGALEMAACAYDQAVAAKKALP